MAANWHSFLHLLFSSFHVFILKTYSIEFQISRFTTGDPNIVYRGQAIPRVGTIELNNNIDYLFQVGSAIYSKDVLLWESRSGKQADFKTHFTFVIDTQGNSQHAAGLAFFLAPSGFQIPPNSAGGFLGLYNTTTADSLRNQIVHVEFDSFPNLDWDPKMEHVGINVNSISSANYTAWNASKHSNDIADAWITYNSTSKILSVSWKYQTTSTSQENTTLSHQIDLMKVLPQSVTIGFSAATSEYTERHVIQSWEFSSSLDAEPGKGKNSNKTWKVVVGSVVAGAVFIVVVISTYVIFRRWKSKKKDAKIERVSSINDDFERGAGPRRFSYEEIVFATNNFSPNRKLGQGGFGAVYRGYFADLDLVVAVKKISSGSRQGKREYVTEVKVISRLRHRNLVQLIGWCHDQGEFLLVYEYMPNGSLDSHLFGNRTPLSWNLRHKIALGLASAILYLHEEWEQCVIHRDIKPSNVMLDSSFNVKLGDFGLAKLIDHELGSQTSALAGTIGYMAPEYISSRRASKESDVYGFGLVALEIATGKRVFDLVDNEESQKGLVEWVWDHYGREELHKVVDERVGKDFDEKEVKYMMIVGMWCCHPDKNMRPSIREAIQVLNLEGPVPQLPTKMPVAIYYIPTSSVSSDNASISVSFQSSGR
ncbi:L-type lectin-domain containing receptor kinase IX.1-like [Arachis duranensis]|uniref:L-type lectin-domain containing receptor kinase IX.1-like n=1 Tax=Arachis duranensis TaxID=130453 RepID=A0A6P5NNZ1_ARADU|nr:L-type lectin-domain containing receptor kinase IX.1-like [Arachis duranensis]